MVPFLFNFFLTKLSIIATSGNKFGQGQPCTSGSYNLLMKQTSDDIILAKLKQGDPSAFTDLYFRYFQFLYLFAKKFVPDERAKDLVQDCFLHFWKKRKNIEIKTSLKSYLFTMLKNLCYKEQASMEKNSQLLEGIDLHLKQKELDFFRNHEHSILEFEVRDRMKLAMERLPDKCALIFKESRFNGLSNKAIAAKHDITVKAVEKHISKALNIFRGAFRDLIQIAVISFWLVGM